MKDLRKTVLRMIAEANTGHLGASLSSIELLAVLYFIKMRHDPENPDWPDRDRFILSKGHAAPALYAVLAELGYIKKSDLSSLRELGSGLQGHPDIRLPGVDASTGSLGHGLSIANGMAIAGKMDGSDRSVYVLLGDGELGEGSIWEAALTASHQGLGNLVAIVDRNDYQLTARTKEVKGLEPISDKWISFGWNVIEAEGNEPDSVLDALDQCTMNREKPNVIIARTTKGKGVSFMEGNRFSNRIPKAEELREALSQLS
ncbi:MAG: transketolase [Candidatus Bathyarchaeia archaeon]